MKALFITTLFFASAAIYAQDGGVGSTATCDCEEYVTPEDHCQLITCQSIVGTIVNDGDAVSCACVKVMRDGTLMFATKTSADGTYSIPDVFMGIFTVEITKGDETHTINNVQMKGDGPTEVSADLNVLPSESSYDSSAY